MTRMKIAGRISQVIILLAMMGRFFTPAVAAGNPSDGGLHATPPISGQKENGNTNESPVATPSELQAALNKTTQGAIVNLYGADPLSCPLISMSQTWTGGKLIFSDSPESPTGAGILYRDANLGPTGPVPNRIFVYHVNNNPSGPMKFSVLIKNKGSTTAVLTVRQTGLAGPSGNYAQVGETAFYRWLTNRTITSVNVRPGETVQLDTNFDSIEIPDRALINGIWDYTFTQPHSIIICALNKLDHPLQVAPTLGLLPRDIHDRGTFLHCDKTYSTSPGTVIDTASGIAQFPFGGDSDTYVRGYDNSVAPHATAINDGNYGVVYSIDLKTASTDGRALALLANPQGGSWCGALAAGAGILPGGAFVIPSKGNTISSPEEAAIAGEYFAAAGKEIHFQFMPTGASSFPVLFLCLPFLSKAPASPASILPSSMAGKP